MTSSVSPKKKNLFPIILSEPIVREVTNDFTILLYFV